MTSSGHIVQIHDNRSGLGSIVQVHPGIAETVRQTLATENEVKPRGPFLAEPEPGVEAGYSAGGPALKIHESEFTEPGQFVLFPFAVGAASPGRTVRNDVEVPTQQALPPGVTLLTNMGPQAP